MIRTTLIDPRGWQGAVYGSRPLPNVGIAYLVSSARKAGQDISVIDLNNELMTDAQVLARIESHRPDLLGFSAKTATIDDAHHLASKAKERWPNLPIVLGGPHTIFFWRDLILEPAFDAVFVGEAETCLPMISSHLLEGGTIELIPGLVTKNTSYPPESPCSHLLSTTDLETIPFPDYDPFPNNVRQQVRESYPLVTSRGCVYKCTYCSVPKISGKRVRKRFHENIIEELNRAKKDYGCRQFEIIDDVFNIDIDRCKDFCSALLRAGLGMRWSCPNGLRADRVDAELAGLMAKSGCFSVMLGVESADAEVLKAVKKGETIEDIEIGIRTFQKAGISVGGYFIIGLPGDSIRSEEKSVEFAKRTGISAHFNMLVPYPGTEIWEWAKKDGRFLSDIQKGLHFADDPDRIHVVFDTMDFPAQERKRAYEMTHTRIGRFDLLIPSRVSQMEYLWRRSVLLWTYDRGAFPSYLLRTLIGKCRAFLSYLVRLFKRTYHQGTHDRNSQPS